jgi:hypothetical protein
MGVIHNHKGGKLNIQLYGVNPGKNRIKQFGGVSGTESMFSDIIKDMKQNNELLKMDEVIV